MPVFYHVQRNGVAGFKVGRSYNFGSQQNFFARDLFGVDVIVPVAATEGMPIDYLLRDYFDPTGFNHYRNIRSKTATPDEKGLLKSSLSALNHQAMLLRELIFEQLRSDDPGGLSHPAPTPKNHYARDALPKLLPHTTRHHAPPDEAT